LRDDVSDDCQIMVTIMASKWFM